MVSRFTHGFITKVAEWCALWPNQPKMRFVFDPWCAPRTAEGDRCLNRPKRFGPPKCSGFWEGKWDPEIFSERVENLLKTLVFTVFSSNEGSKTVILDQKSF